MPFKTRRFLQGGGSGGAAPAFNPADHSPIIWLDFAEPNVLFQERTGAAATTPAVSIGDPIGTWRDRSGNNRHAVTISDTRRPTIQENNNGAQAVWFDGLDDYLGIESSIVSAPFVVAAAVSIGSSSSGLLAGFYSYNRAVSLRHTPYNSGNTAWQLGEAPGTTYRIGTTDFGGEQDAVVTAVIADPLEFWLTNELGENTDLSGEGPPDPVAAAALLHLCDDGSAAREAEHFVFEFLIFSYASVYSHLSELRSYLNTKWGIY